MTAAEAEARADDAPKEPKGCVRAVAPDGKTPIWVKTPRGPGPWWRVKHIQYGHRVVQAATADEALTKFFAEFNPGMAADLAWCKESMRLNGGRIAKLPGDEPESAPKKAPDKKAAPAG